MLSSRGNASHFTKPLYSFPELKNNEILECLTDLRIPITMEELSKPSSASVQRLFQSFIEFIIGDPEVSSERFLYEATETVAFPELHVEGLTLLDLFRAAQPLMQTIGVDDFSLRDLIRPEAARLRLILSAVINFAKFREEQIVILERLSKKTEESTNLKGNLTRKLSEVTEKLNNIKAILMKEEPQCYELKEKISFCLEELRSLKKIQVGISKELEDLKSEKEAIQGKMVPTRSAVAALKADIGKLSGRLMENTDVLVESVMRLNDCVLSEKSAVTAVEKKSRELLFRLQCLTSLSGELSEISSYLDTILDEVSRAQIITQDLRKGHQEAERLSLLVRDFEIKDEYYSRQHTLVNEKLCRLKQVHDERQAACFARLSDLQLQYNELSKQKMQALEVIRDVEEKEKDCLQKLAKLKRIKEAETQATRNEYILLKSKVDHYFSELQKNL